MGGGASRERVAEAFKIILDDPDVQGVFVNIFGGIMRCDVIAEGIVDAAAQVGCTLPIVVRMDGTLVDKGREILLASGLNVDYTNFLADGVEKIVSQVGKLQS